MISHIAAVSRNRVIGNNGSLPWHLPEDLKFFKAKTLNKCIIMGRKTYESLGKPLPKRHNVIVTRNKDFKAPGCEVFTDIQEALRHCESLKDTYGDEIMIVGGAEIYKQTLPYTDRLYLTLIEKDIPGDAFYPEWPSTYKLIEKTESAEGDIRFSFCTFEKPK